MSKGKRSAAVNAKLRGDLADTISRAERAERRVAALEHELEQARQRVRDLAGGADLVAERDRFAAAERRHAEQIAETHDHYRSIHEDAKWMVRHHWRLANAYINEHDDLHGQPTFTNAGVAAMSAMWPDFPWSDTTTDPRKMRRLMRYQGKAIRDQAARDGKLGGDL